MSLRPFLPACWLIAYWYFCWAVRDMRPTHPELWRALERRRHYAGLLGFADAPQNRHVPAWMPAHWNCRCQQPRPLTPRRELPR